MKYHTRLPFIRFDCVAAPRPDARGPAVPHASCSHHAAAPRLKLPGCPVSSVVPPYSLWRTVTGVPRTRSHNFLPLQVSTLIESASIVHVQYRPWYPFFLLRFCVLFLPSLLESGFNNPCGVIPKTFLVPTATISEYLRLTA